MMPSQYPHRFSINVLLPEGWLLEGVVTGALLATLDMHDPQTGDVHHVGVDIVKRIALVEPPIYIAPYNWERIMGAMRDESTKCFVDEWVAPPVKDLRQQLAERDEQLQSLTKQLGDAQEQQKVAAAQLVDLTNEVGALQEERSELMRTALDQHETIRQLNAVLDAMEQERRRASSSRPVRLVRRIQRAITYVRSWVS